MQIPERTPSRLLNDNSVLFGLSFGDLIGAAVVMFIAQLTLKPFHHEGTALIIGAMVLFLLVPIRVRYQGRRKVVRDYLRGLVSPSAYALRERAFSEHPRYSPGGLQGSSQGPGIGAGSSQQYQKRATVNTELQDADSQSKRL